MEVLGKVLAFIVTISVLVTIHELGHYFAAHAFGVKILRFSLGFGKPLWTKVAGRDRTEWVVAALPLGGFVRMADVRDGSLTAGEESRGFSTQPMHARMLIILAGPLANLALAAMLYWGIFVMGTPGVAPYVAAPSAGSAAASEGIREWDLIRRIDGANTQTWSDVRMHLLDAASARRVAEVVYERDGAERVARISLSELSSADLDSDFMGKIGLTAYRLPVPSVLARVVEGSPAARAGLRAGDRVVEIAGARIDNWEGLVRAVIDRPGVSLAFAVDRPGEGRLEVNIVPEAVKRDGKTIGRVGVEPKIDRSVYDKLAITVRYGLLESIPRAVAKVWDTSIFSLKMMWRMITGNVSWKNLSGPLTIADYAGQSASLGWLPYVTFLALVSVSLGVLNLLPIPLLDGGQLMYHIAEWMKGSPVSDRAMEIGQQLGLMLLLCLTAFAFYNDIQRLVSG